MAHDGRIAILGGGPTGLACALLLARRGRASIVIEARRLDEALRETRLLALSRGTWQLLEPLLGTAPPRTASIRTVHVSSAGEFGVTRIADADFDGAPLGATVLYGDLLAALASAVDAQPAIEVLRPRRATEVLQRPDAVRVALEDGTTLEAPLAINAEGLPSAAASADKPRDSASSRVSRSAASTSASCAATHSASMAQSRMPRLNP
jgi:2-octaprenyl-6-methoxyphenol hydroxylase